MGWRCVGYVEQDEYCKKVLRARIRDGIFDDAPIFDDVRTFDGLPYRGRVDCIVAGFPCQPFSVAGKQRATADERNMWPDTARIIGQVRPPQVFLENVPGLLSWSHGYFGSILGELADLRFDVKWDCVSASDIGALHRRRRLWIVADANREHLRNELERNQKALRTEAVTCTDGKTESLADAKGVGWKPRAGVDGVSAKNKDGADTERRNWWSVEPELDRMAYGVADRCNRLKALGNGIVPSVAREAWLRLA